MNGATVVPLFLLLTVSPAAASPPANDTYFVVLVGVDAPYSWHGDCLTFTETELCSTVGGDCGTWSRTGPEGREMAIAFELSYEEDGEEVRIVGQGRIDDRGKQSSLAAAAHVEIGGKTSNFGVTGRSTGRRKCSRVLRDFMTDGVMKTPDCYRRAHFADPSESEYVLPFPQGTSYRVMTSYCSRGGHPKSIAYDFDMPVGSEVVAARAGTVVMVWEDTPDEPDEIRPNGLFIEHDDGTIGSYAHITRDGVLVEEGDRVEAGQVIAIGGTSGTSDPHLHFMVYQSYPTHPEDDDIPVSFRNVDGPLDERGGLMWDHFYTAVPE
jgi:hypothetical protein